MGKVREWRLSFEGDKREYIRLWLKGMLLSIITLGIYSPWLTINQKQYFWAHTKLAGYSFEYTGRPLYLLWQRIATILLAALLFWVFWALWENNRLLTIIVVIMLTVLCSAPLLLIKKQQQISNLIYNGMFFDYRGKVGDMALIIALWLTLSGWIIFFPLILYHQHRLMTEGSEYGSTAFKFSSRLSDYYEPFVTLLALAVSAQCFFIAWYVSSFGLPSFLSAGIKSPEANLSTTVEAEATSIAALVIITTVGLLLFTLLGAYLSKHLWTLRCKAASLSTLKVRSRQHTLQIAWLLLSNTLACIATLGLLWPWARLRWMSYVMKTTSIVETSVENGLEAFLNQEAQRCMARGVPTIYHSEEPQENGLTQLARNWLKAFNR